MLNKESALEKALKYNKAFVEQKEYLPFVTTKYPDTKVAILTCMDTRLVELLPAALGFKNGCAKIIKNAGAIISHPYESVIRSLLVAIYDLAVEEVWVIGHTDCGMEQMNSQKLIDKMKARGISEDTLSHISDNGICFDSWLHGFDEVNEAILKTAQTVKDHPLIPKDVKVVSMLMDSTTGEVTLL